MDDSHAANKLTRRGHTGFIILLNRAPIIWYRKIQNNVEAIAFYSECIAAISRVEHMTTLRFKLHMLRIPVVDSTKIIFDNESVVNNSSILSSILNKNCIYIAYHFVRLHLLAGVIKVSWIDTNATLADSMTKIFTVKKRGALFGKWTY